MPTVQDCINGLQATYALVSDAQALIYFNQIHRELIEQSQIQLGSETISLNTGQREYAMSATNKIVKVRSCSFVSSATVSHELQPVSTDWLDEHASGWRTEDFRGEPEKFYIESIEPTGESRIGFHPIPISTTVAGYPNVIVFGSKFQSLIATDSIPAAIPSIRVYVEGMKKLAASDTDVVHFDEYENAYRNELHKTLLSINGTIEDMECPRIVPVWMKNRKIQ